MRQWAQLQTFPKYISGFWTAPWWLAEGRNSQSPERASLCNHFGVCMSVCLYVCLWSSYRSQFSTLQPNFLKVCSLELWEKRFFSVFWNFHFWRFYGPFSLFSEFFPLCLCIGRKPPHSTYKHNFWHVGSLWHRIFDDLRAIFDNFWQFYRIFHLLYIVFGIGT